MCLAQGHNTVLPVCNCFVYIHYMTPMENLINTVELLMHMTDLLYCLNGRKAKTEDRKNCFSNFNITKLTVSKN